MQDFEYVLAVCFLNDAVAPELVDTHIYCY